MIDSLFTLFIKPLFYFSYNYKLNIFWFGELAFVGILDINIEQTDFRNF